MKRALIALTFTASACGGPTGPSGPSSAFLEGQWRGTLTVTKEGGQPVSGPTTWSFALVPNTSGYVFHTTIESSNAWLPVSMTGSATLTPPGQPGSAVNTDGEYRSPRGCSGLFSSNGTASIRSLSASFHGVDCHFVPFTGSVELSR